jgi:hypothetical protein
MRAEVMPVVQPEPRERRGVGTILGGAEHVGLLAVPSDAIAPGKRHARTAAPSGGRGP